MSGLSLWLLQGWESTFENPCSVIWVLIRSERAGLFSSLSPIAWLICSSAVCQLKGKNADVYKLDTCPNSSWRDAISGNTELQNIRKAACFSYWVLEITIWYQCQWIRPLLLNSSCCQRDFQSQTMDNCWAKLHLLLRIAEISLYFVTLLLFHH